MQHGHQSPNTRSKLPSLTGESVRDCLASQNDALECMFHGERGLERGFWPPADANLFYFY